MHKFIPVFESVFNGNEKKYLNECIDSGWIGYNGGFVKKIEGSFSKYCNQKYASCVSSGSAALDVAIRAMKNLYKWDNYSEIIIPTFNIISSAQSCINNKLKPVFVDAESLSWNVDVNKIEKMITSKTKAIIVVHIYGLPSDMDSILDIAKKYSLKIIEDAAQVHGQTYKGRMCGSFGDVSTFSFYSNKHISSGEGGIILTSNEDLYNLVNYYKNLCFTSNRFIHEDIGWNYRMTNLQAAVACAQLEKINETVAIKKNIGKTYQKLLKDMPIQLPLKSTTYAENHYWVFGIVLNKNSKLTAKEMILKLREKNIESRPFFYPMHKQPIFKKIGILDNIKRPVSENLYEKGFYIPAGLNLTVADMKYVSDSIREIISSLA